MFFPIVDISPKRICYFHGDEEVSASIGLPIRALSLCAAEGLPSPDPLHVPQPWRDIDDSTITKIRTAPNHISWLICAASTHKILAHFYCATLYTVTLLVHPCLTLITLYRVSTNTSATNITWAWPSSSILYPLAAFSTNHNLLEMWANAQRDGRPVEYKWHPLFNAAKFG